MSINYQLVLHKLNFHLGVKATILLIYSVIAPVNI
jgi:hypothetical protein